MIVAPGSTGVIKHVFIQDSSVSNGAGKTALAYGDITAYYVRAGGTLTALTLEDISTLGTWASSGDDYLGFKLLNDTNAPGLYELHLPDNIFAEGANQVTIPLRATGAFCAPIEIDLGYGLAAVHITQFNTTDNPGYETVYDKDGNELFRKAVATDEAALPVTGVSNPA